MGFISLLIALFVVLVIAGIIAFAILASPLFAALIFIVCFAAFLVWRGARRTRPARQGGATNVPSTEETAPNPASESGARDVHRGRTATG